MPFLRTMDRYVFDTVGGAIQVEYTDGGAVQGVLVETE